jgi:putative hemolysin
MELLLGIGLILVLILLSGFFSMAETALVSARKSRLQQQAEAGSAKARTALDLAAHPDRFLSTVQIFISLIGVLSGAFGEQRISDHLAPRLQAMGVAPATSSTLSFWLAMIGITYVSLVLGELVPKRLALNSAEGIAATVAVPMQALSRFTHPLVSLLSGTTNGVLRLLGMRPSSEPPITEDEVRILIAQGTQAGVFEDAEQELVERVFRLGDRRANSLMTPRMEMAWLDAEDPFEENWRKICDSSHSWLPLCQGDPDHVLGVIPLQRLLHCADDRRPSELTTQDLHDAALPPLVVPATMRAFRLLDVFKESEHHVAIVADEFGGTTGVVTLYDVLEAIVGDVRASQPEQDAAVVRREDGSWLLDGMLEKEELQDLLGLPAMPEAGHYSTLGGFVMTQIGRLPATGDTFEWSGHRFEVVDMDGHRVDRVLVTNAHPSPD